MLKKIVIFSSLATLIFFSGCNKKTVETSLPLSEQGIEEAIEYGIKNAGLSTTEFVSDWTVNLGYGEGKGTATIVTPFLKVALLSKQAEMAGQKVNRTLIEKVLKEEADKLTFDILLFGGYPQFGRSVQCSLKYNNKIVHPLYQFVPPYGEMGRDYTQTAKGTVKFQKEDIAPTAKVVLSCSFNTTEEGKEKYTCEFEFDLSKYR
ncbi:MAG: hypothetical protein ACPLYF_02445 [Fervidobacterium sp.]